MGEIRAPGILEIVDEVNTAEDRASVQQPVASRSSLLSGVSTVCRICQEGDATERLISPCNCKGTFAYVHFSCLDRWLNQSGRSSCEVCMFEYRTIKVRRYSLCRSLRMWVRHPRNRGHTRTNCFVVILLSLFTIGLVGVCLFGMHHFIHEGRKLGISRLWMTGVMSFFMTLVILVFIISVFLILKDQLAPWYRWWKRCVNVTLILDPAVSADVTSLRR